MFAASSTKDRVGRPAVWSAESALVLMVQGINLEPLDRILPRTGGRDLPHVDASSSKRSAVVDQAVRPWSIGRDVCLWHLADIDGGDEYVCFQV
jgi:hypothetical protein